MALIIGLLALALAIWELLRSGQKILKVGWKGWVNILMSLGAKYRKPTDVSYLLIPPPPISKKNIEALKAIGFRRLGEAQIKSPFKPPITVWVFFQTETHIQAEAAWKRVGFSTYFQDKTLVVTDFPNGERIEMPNYQSHTIMTSVADAYQYHLRQVTKFSQKYGDHHPIRSMSEYLHWEAVGRKHYGTIKLMRWIRADIVRLITFTYGILVLSLTPIFFNPKGFLFIPQTSVFSSREILIYTIILLLSPAILISQYFNRWNVRQTHQDSRSAKKT
jgi:hypothetical protein